MAFVPMRYGQHYFSVSFNCFVTIYHVDGTVAISHSGIEMGQGINTKVQLQMYVLNWNEI